MQNQLEGLSFNFRFIVVVVFFFHRCVDVNARCFLCPASINEMPTPASVFVFIRTSYKIFYNPFRVIKVKLTYSRYSLFHHHQSHSTNKVKNHRGKRRWGLKLIRSYMETPCLWPSEGNKYGDRQLTKNICHWVCYKKPVVVFRGLINIYMNTFSHTWTVQIAKSPRISHVLFT